jgi:hypothetical protein
MTRHRPVDNPWPRQRRLEKNDAVELTQIVDSERFERHAMNGRTQPSPLARQLVLAGWSARLRFD